MLTLLSWNVLADPYVRRGYYPSTPPALLAPGARTRAIVDRLVRSAAALICLQEVEPPVFAALRDALGQDYAARYLPKGHSKPDGCATFVRRDTLAVVHERELVFPDGSGHVALITHLRQGAAALALATTHLKWDAPGTPASARWASRQVPLLLASLQNDLPWLVCGDFNMTPEDPALDAFAHAGLRDAYARAPFATANPNGQARRIDYVFHSAALTVEPLPLVRIAADTALPSATEPSDHLCIGAHVGFP